MATQRYNDYYISGLDTLLKREGRSMRSRATSLFNIFYVCIVISEITLRLGGGEGARRDDDNSCHKGSICQESTNPLL
jgi:hypothetical protein